MMNHWMFNCKAVTQIVSESMDRVLPIHHQVLIRMHLLMCKYCARFNRQLLVIREVCRSEEMMSGESDDTPVLPKEACERIKKSLQKPS
jgi:predicted anti-sigma-YlaC factor YlaD